MRVFGTIEDAFTEKLLPGALITLKVGDTELIEHTPTRDGQIDYEIPDSSLPIDEDTLTCVVEKRGYKTQTTRYTITGDAVELSIELVPDPIDWKRIFKVSGIILAAIAALIILFIAYKILFPPLEPAILSFKLEPDTIKSGEKAVLKWETKDSDQVLLDGKEVKATDIITVNPGKDRRYILTIVDKEGVKRDLKRILLTIIPPPPTILSFTATPSEIHLWDPAVLEWKTEGTVNISIYSNPENPNVRIIKEKGEEPEDEKQDPDAAPIQELNGRAEVAPLETTVFTLVAENSVGVKREESVTVTVLEAPRIISFSASTQIVEAGGGVILYWKTEKAEKVFLNGERTGPIFSFEVHPAETTSYTLQAVNKVGKRERSLVVKVPGPVPPLSTETPGDPEIQRFRISRPVIGPGQLTELSWATDNADRVYLRSKPLDPLEAVRDKTPLTPEEKEAQRVLALHFRVESIAGEPIEGGTVTRVRPVDALMVSPRVSTRYEIRAVNNLKEISWTRLVKVLPQACTVIFYERDNYRGRSSSFTASSPHIGLLNNRVSSIKIVGTCGITVYSAANFKATRQSFSRGIPSLKNTWIGSDTITSFKFVSPNVNTLVQAPVQKDEIVRDEDNEDEGKEAEKKEDEKKEDKKNED